MKILFVNPLDRDDVPRFPIQIAILAGMADTAGHKVDAIDLNALREVSSNEAILGITKKEEGEGMMDYDLVWVVASCRAFTEARRLVDLVRDKLPTAVTVLAGSAATSMPADALRLIRGLDVAVVGDQEEAFVDIVERVPGQRWDSIKGIAFRAEHGVRRNPPRPPRENLDEVALPNYRFVHLDRYFGFSPLPLCQQGMMSKRRMTFSWQREYDGSVRFPSPKRAIQNIAEARFKYAIDFATMDDQGIMGQRSTWFKEFAGAYVEEGLHEIVPWTCWVDPVQIARDPGIVRLLKDAGCVAVQMEVEHQKGLDSLRGTAISALKRAGIQVGLRYVVGAPDQTIDDMASMAYLSFSTKTEPYEVRQADIYPDGPHFEAHRKEILEPWGGSLEAFLDDSTRISPVSWSKLGLSFADIAALRLFVGTKDLGNILRLAHLRGQPHAEEWKPHCPICEVEALAKA